MKIIVAIVVMFLCVGCQKGESKPEMSDSERSARQSLFQCENENSSYKGEIRSLEKALATSPETLQRVWRLKGLKSFVMTAPTYIYRPSYYWNCTITLAQEGLEKDLTFPGSGSTPEEALVKMLSRIDATRKKLCEAMEETK